MPTKSARKNRVEEIFQQMYQANEADQISTLMAQASELITNAPYIPAHQDVVPLTVHIAAEDIVQKLTNNLGQEMSPRDRAMVSYQMGQIRNLIDSSLLPED